jgi:hypothetical protein
MSSTLGGEASASSKARTADPVRRVRRADLTASAWSRTVGG